MKKIGCCFGLFLCLALCACDAPQEESLPVQNDRFEFVSQEEYMLSAEKIEVQEISEEEAEPVREALTDALGAVDTETGFSHVFLIQGKISLSDGTYYLGQWGWIIEENGQQETKMIEGFIISEDLSRAYSAVYDQTQDTLTWYTNYNWLD